MYTGYLKFFGNSRKVPKSCRLGGLGDVKLERNVLKTDKPSVTGLAFTTTITTGISSICLHTWSKVLMKKAG